MKKIPLLFLLMLLAGACVQKKPDTGRASARSLYTQSLKLLDAYSDSVARARDSATLLGIMERFDKKMIDLNYSFPPETDTRLSEGENDTLSTKALRIAALRDSLLYSYAHPVSAADTVPVDSITEVLPAK